MPDFAEPLARLIQEFKRLPGVGQKSAQRLAFHVLRNSREDADRLATALVDVKDKLGICIACNNIIGVVEGSGPLAKETVVIGAHYDHLGYGGPASRAKDRNKKEIHHGADDNASGSTSVIELARRFGARPEREGRRMVFMTFSGEELGLFGSVHYCKEPLFPLADTVAMLKGTEDEDWVPAWSAVATLFCGSH